MRDVPVPGAEMAGAEAVRPVPAGAGAGGRFRRYVTFREEDRIADQLIALADRRGCTVSAIVRRALRVYLAGVGA